MIITIYHTAKCGDCAHRCDFYYGRQKQSRCMLDEKEGAKPHLTSKPVTRKSLACASFKHFAR